MFENTRTSSAGSPSNATANHPREVDARVIFATHRDIQNMVSEGKFREDLWHRINGFPVAVPPLREREGDVQFLAAAFLAECVVESGTPRRLAEETCRALELHTWPGNVRELRSVIERAYWLAEDEVIVPDDLDLGADTRGRGRANEWFLQSHAAAVGEFERAYFTELLARFPTKVQAARAACRPEVTMPRSVHLPHPSAAEELEHLPALVEHRADQFPVATHVATG